MVGLAAAVTDRSEEAESRDAPWPVGFTEHSLASDGPGSGKSRPVLLKQPGSSKASGTATPPLPTRAGWPRFRPPPGPVLLCSVPRSYLGLFLQTFCGQDGRRLLRFTHGLSPAHLGKPQPDPSPSNASPASQRCRRGPSSLSQERHRICRALKQRALSLWPQL